MKGIQETFLFTIKLDTHTLHALLTWRIPRENVLT